jgi:hypothetical protein
MSVRRFWIRRRTLKPKSDTYEWHVVFYLVVAKEKSHIEH